MKKEDGGLKKRLIHEVDLFLLYTLFFALFFALFGTYKRLILGEYAISYVHYGYSLVEAAILSKVILLGESFKLGQRFDGECDEKPLIYPVAYKTVLFSVFAFIFAIVEHFVMGFFEGKTSQVVYNELISKGLDQILATLLVMTFVIFIFFSFLELCHFFGPQKIYTLFFKTRSGLSNRKD